MSIILSVHACRALYIYVALVITNEWSVRTYIQSL